MRLLLINPFLRQWTYQIFPLGIGYVAGAALNAGHDVSVLDINALAYGDAGVKEYIRTHAYDAVGVGGMATSYAYVKKLIAMLKEIYPDKPVILGGALTAGIEKLWLEKTAADVIVSGEAETIIPELLQSLSTVEGLSTVPGIYYRDSGTIAVTPPSRRLPDMDALPDIPYRLFPMDRYLGPRQAEFYYPSAFDLMASRGCPFRCGFCSRILGQQLRYRSVENVIRQIEGVMREHDIRHFCFLDETFTARRDWVIDFCETLMRREIPIAFSCSTRVHLVDAPLLRKMAEAGCKSISFGVESYNMRVLSRMQKDITPQQIDRAIELCLQAGILVHITYMFGYPSETLESIYETVKFLFSYTKNFMSDYFVPLPGSRIYDELKAAGAIGDEDAYLEGLPEHFSRPYINVTSLSDFELQVFPALVFKRLYAQHHAQQAAMGAKVQ